MLSSPLREKSKRLVFLLISIASKALALGEKRYNELRKKKVSGSKRIRLNSAL